MKYDEIKKRIQEMSLVSYKEQLFAGTSGNLSEFIPQEGLMAITPSSVDYLEMRPEQVVIMTLDGEVIEGEKPSSEWRMHSYVYKNRSDVKAIVHTHSPYATGFAVAGEPIPIILIEMIPFLGGEIPLAKFAIPGTVEVGIECVKVMGSKKSCLMENHGVLVVGNNLSAAHRSAQYVEDAAKIYYFARTLGNPNVIPEYAVKIMKEKYNLK